MDPNVPTTSQIVSQLANAQTIAPKNSLLKSLINLRINRKTFLIGVILDQVIYFLAFGFLVSWQDPLVDTLYFPLFYTLLHIVSMLFYIWRLHDINRSGFWILIILIPRIISHIPYTYSQLLLPRMLVDLIFTVFLLYKKGSETTNDYAEKPKKFSNLF